MIEYTKTSQGYFLRIEKDAKMNQTLGQFAIDHKIRSGFLFGLGALKNCELGFYHLHKKDYDRKFIEHECELLNVSGNISWLDGKPVVHTHVTLGTESFQAIGGHLFEGEVAVTVEIFLSTFDVDVQRKFRPDIGLNLLSFCKIQ